MRESPLDRPDIAYPAQDLSRFRYHTGATLRSLRPDEPCPVLFRDLGVDATILFLGKDLQRLAGPLSPIVYMRTEGYVEPYTDHEHIGRLVFLRPLQLRPWHSGIDPIYVASASAVVDYATIAFVPGEVALADAATMAADVVKVEEWRETLGGRIYDEALSGTRDRLIRLQGELAATEEQAGPLRACLQSADRKDREIAREEMLRLGLTESDLCTAWHHLPRTRRESLTAALHELRLPGGC